MILTILKTPLQDNSIPLFDLHCDTFTKIYKQATDFNDDTLHISLSKIRNFSPYTQVAAIWSDRRLSDEDTYLQYVRCLSYIKQLKLCENNARSPHFVLAVEDARLLNGDITRLQRLYSDGVRMITLCWKDVSCIGGGWNTSAPLTEFGVSVVKECIRLGIIIDLSHSSLPLQEEVFAICEKNGASPIFSHSNSYSVHPHLRNISDDAFLDTIRLGGVVGISLCPEHLGIKTDIYDVLRHIDRYLSLGGQHNVCLGCDFDGIDTTPHGLDDVQCLTKLYSLIKDTYGKTIADNIFYFNAYNFFTKHERR